MSWANGQLNACTNSTNDIKLYILTDLGEQVPDSLKKTVILKVEPGVLGKGFSSKLYLDRYSPADQTLFIDADCFCLRALDAVFERFAGRSVSVIGGEISEGEWFGDVAAVCSRAGVRSLPKFNGGIYYVEPGPKATAVYERARGLEPHYDELGLIRLRGLPNDELLMAIAMAQEGCTGIVEDGSIMGDFLATPQFVELDVLGGRCVLRNPIAPDPLHNSWFPLDEVRPAVVHFLGHHVTSWIYQRESFKLKLVTEAGVPVMLARVIAWAYVLPIRVTESVKDIFRPLFHHLFGPRKLKAGIR